MSEQPVHDAGSAAPEPPPQGALARVLALVEAVPRPLWRVVGAAVGVAVVVLVAIELHRELAGVTLGAVRAAIVSISWLHIAFAIIATLGSFLSLVGYEFVALRHVDGKEVSRKLAALTAFISYSFTFVLGFGVLTGGAVRLRRYKAAGLPTGQILAVTLLGVVSFWSGLAVVAGLCLVLEPAALASALSLPTWLARGAGLVVLASVAAWMALGGRRESTVTLQSWTARLPGREAILTIVALGIADVTLAALALWQLLPADMAIGFAGFFAIFAVATVAGVLSHVPGGLGAFEAVILLGLPGDRHADVAAALVLFRLIYYLLPFTLALGLFVASEARGAGPRLAATGRNAQRALAPFVPRLAAMAVVVGGVVLLVSGALPVAGTRAALLARWVPLPFVETSHFIASAVGAGLILVGYGLLRRRRTSLHIAVALLGAGALFSLIKGVDYEEAFVCLAVMGLLIASRRAFYRGSDAFADPPSLRWLAVATALVALSVWVGLLAYRHVSYGNDLWWQFALHGDASRFLRASVGTTIVLIAIGLYRLIDRPSRRPRTPAPDFDAVAALVARSRDTEANLAFLGDKAFLFSTAGNGFIMYAVEGTTYLAMSDPVADDPKTTIDLIWRFRELADRSGSDPAFYQVKAALLPHYIDAGFSFAKLGEDAVVDLTRFSLDGPAGAKMRQVKSRAERTGLSFAIVPAAEVPTILPQLHEISDAWLSHQKGREKGFSLGFWSEPYLERFDQAVVSHDGHPIAFANIWRGGGLSEMCIDLMRHRADMPNGTMDFLFISLMAAAKAEGYATFNLGLAPLSGLPDHPLAPAWSRFGALIYKHGNQFYNFRGLRDFKAKFKPDWQPRYLAHTGSLAAPRVLLDATRLISKGPQAPNEDDRDGTRT